MILPFTIGQPCQSILNLIQVGINGRKVMESSIVLNTGCIGFLPFLVQLLIHLSDDLIEKCGKAVSLQTVHVSLFRQLGFFQLFQTISKRISLGGQFFLFCFTAFLFCDLLPKLFQCRITHMECPFPALRFFVQKLVQKMLPIIYKCFGDNVAVRIFILTRICLLYTSFALDIRPLIALCQILFNVLHSAVHMALDIGGFEEAGIIDHTFVMH